jgi:lipoprotein signal peptidase
VLAFGIIENGHS